MWTDSELQATAPEKTEVCDPLVTRVFNPKQPPDEGVTPIVLVRKLKPGGDCTEMIVERAIGVCALTSIVREGISERPPKKLLAVTEIFAMGCVRANPGSADWSRGISFTKVPTIHEADPEGVESWEASVGLKTAVCMVYTEPAEKVLPVGIVSERDN